MTTISHLKTNPDNPASWIIQDNDEHCKNVAELASEFAKTFGLPECGRIIGLLHDKGKEKTAFQDYIKRNSGYDPSAPRVSDDKKTHAYVGGLITRRYGGPYDFMGNILMGHHRGLYNGKELVRKYDEPIPSEVSIPSTLPPVDSDLIPISKKFGKGWRNHLSRMLFSCLVDADYLDTERFMEPETFGLRGSSLSITELKPMLDDYLTKFSSCPDTEVNRIRREVQEDCKNASALAPGLFSLTVPTGGGKTLSSLMWAINHAIAYGKRRIIIAIPFTSIVAQTSATLREIFGKENVLEHHSNVEYDETERRDNMAYLATQNWDAPIIVTTNVQLLESIYSNRPSRCRKLHNMVRSVIILDEAQALPLEFLQPIVDALKAYVSCFGVSVLFSTATQPSLTGEYRGNTSGDSLKGFDPDSVREIILPQRNLSVRLKRVNLHTGDLTPMSYEEIAARLKRHQKALCIVNTRRHAREITRLMENSGHILVHLSKNMCSAHIMEQIKTIKDLLSDPESKLIVISTQLIEAGVDIDFPVVYRQLAGLDSILQASGRCNREGRIAQGDTYIFRLNEEGNCGYITQGANSTLSLLDAPHDETTDWFSPEMISSYFTQLYSRVKSFDTHAIQSKLTGKFDDINFEDAAQDFKLISTHEIDVVVPFEEGATLLKEYETELSNHRSGKSVLRRLSNYTVGITPGNLRKLQERGMVRQITEFLWSVDDPGQYDNRLGLLLESHWDNELILN